MGRIGISITKSCSFRNGTQEFSNVYYYENVVGLPDESAAQTLINELVTFEKTIHTGSVTFVRGRCWSAGLGAAGNNMISQINLSGTGSAAAITTIDRERAFLFRIRAGVDSRGNPVYLRKWYHTLGNGPGAVVPSSAVIANTGSFTTTERNTMATAIQTIGAIGGGSEDWKLCSKAGRFPTAGASWEAHPFFEHHQFGDMWRAQ